MVPAPVDQWREDARPKLRGEGQGGRALGHGKAGAKVEVRPDLEAH